MINRCNECQIHAKKKPKAVAKQLSAVRPMEILSVDLMVHNGQHALVSVDYFSGYITFDPIPSDTTEAFIKALNNIFKKFGLA